MPRRGGSGAGQPRRLGGFRGLQTRRPGLVVLLSFAAAILVPTLLLMLPASREAGQPPSFVQALFTATSAICVTRPRRRGHAEPLVRGSAKR